MPSKLTTEEFITKAQAVHGDKYDYSEVDYQGATLKIAIICSIHGIFKQSPRDHLKGCGCPQCGKQKQHATYSVDDFIVKAREIHGNKYDYSKVEYINNHTKICIICPEHGVFWQLPRNHLAGKQCPLCGTISRVAELTKTTECFIQEAKKVHGDKYDYSKVNYKNSASHVCIICPKHGEFWQVANRHLQGQGCPVCGHEIVSTKLSYTTEDFIAKACEVHGNKYNYSKVEYHNNDNKVCIECPEHGDFWQTPGAHLSGQGCPQCGLIRRATNNTKTTTQFISEARRIHGNKYNYDKTEYRSYNEKVCIVCAEHGAFWQLPYVHLNGSGCPICGFHKCLSTGPYSQPEEDLYILLCEKFGIDSVHRQYFDKERYPFHCDFYIASLDLFIELNAFWSHGGHWFDENNNEDKRMLLFMQEKDTKFYNNAIHTWTVRDPLKRKTAEENNLNYLVFWDNDLTDAKAWLATQ